MLWASDETSFAMTGLFDEPYARCAAVACADDKRFGIACAGCTHEDWSPAVSGVIPVQVRIFMLSALLGALLSTLYLCKCMLGIDVIDGPSPLHNMLYWIVDGHAG